MKPDSFDVCLIYLPKPFLKQPDAQAPLGLMYLAAVLEEAGKTVVLKNYASFSDESAIDDLPYASLYGITITGLEVLQANRFSKLIKHKYKNAKICVGGPGTYSDEFIDFNCIDAAVQGDGEEIILKLLDHAKKNQLRQIYITGRVQNLDSLPLPARHLLVDRQGGNIFAHDKIYASGDSTIILSSRGCIMSCAFCSAPKMANGKIRCRSPKKVGDEIKHVVDNYGIRQFRFSDDMFTMSRQRVFELCEEIGKHNVFWRISCRVNPLDKDILKSLWDAGCRELSFGIESFDNAVLHGLNKKASSEDNQRALEMSAEHGFSVRVLFMIATPFQTRETININKKYIESTPFSIIACTQFIPIPGCDVWNNPDKYNIEILEKDLDKYNFYMFGPDGRRPIQPIIKIKDRPLDEFLKESEEFRDFLQEKGIVNEG